MSEQVVTRFILETTTFDKQLEDTIKGMEGFASAEDDAAKGAKSLEGSLGSTGAKFKAVEAASKGAGGGLDTFGKKAKDTGGVINTIGQELNKAFPAFGRIATAARAMGTAITTALGPVGIAIAAIVAAFAALVKIFAGTQEGADRLNRVIQPLLRVFDALLGIAQRAGKVLVDIFSSPIESAGKLADVIKSVVVEAIRSLTVTVTAAGEILAAVLSGDQVQLGLALSKLTTEAGRQFDNVKGAVDAVGGAVRNLQGELLTAAQAGARIAQIDVELRKVALERAQNEGRINRELEEQRAIVSDVTKTAQERQAAGEKFRQLQKELTALETRRLDLEIERGQLAASTSDTSDEEKIRIAELISAKEQALADEQAATRRVNTTINGLNKQAADQAIAEQRRVAEERRKIAEQEQKEAERKAQAIAKAEEQVTAIVTKAEEERFQAGLSDAEREERLVELRYQKEVEAAKAAFEQLAKLNEGNADMIAEIRQRESDTLLAIKANENEELLALQRARDEALAEEDARKAKEEADRLQEQQQARIETFKGLADDVSGVLNAFAEGQIQTAEQAGKALVGLALQQAEKLALIKVFEAFAVETGTKGLAGVATGLALGVAIKAAFAALRGQLGRKDGEAYVGGKPMFSGTDGHLRFLDKGERVVRTKTNERYFPLLEMMEKGTFDRWLYSNMSAKTSAPVTATSTFSDKRLVGALGSVGSITEQRKQTAILQQLAAQRKYGKRYFA